MKFRAILPIFLLLFRKLSLDYQYLRNRDRLLILVFHKVSDKQSTFHSPMPTQTYERLCLFLRKHFEIIHFSEVEKFYHSKNYKKPAAIITFDDGLIDIRDHVFPFMKEHGMKFNINIDTEILQTSLPQDFLKVYDILNLTNPESYTDEKYMNTPILVKNRVPIDVESEFTNILSNLSIEQRRDFVQRMATKLKMNDNYYYGVLSNIDVSNLSKNSIVEFGSHTHTHPDLTKLSLDRVEIELCTSKKMLSNLIDREIDIIAYPNGQCNSIIDSLATQLGYRFLLKSEDKFTEIEDIRKGHFYRVNQYHSSFEIGIAHTFGLFRFIKKYLCGKV
jgi:peptidoglycan/xylan/chitin deacetylase (PgdA/CDA1 family)